MLLPHRSSKCCLFFVVAALPFIAGLQAAAAANQLSFNPSGLRFGEVVVGGNATLAASITNDGSTKMTLSTMSVSGATYSVTGLTLPVTLNAGQSVSFSVTFNPTTTGLATGSITFNGKAAGLNLRGRGISSNSLTSNPPNLAFGNVQAGSTKALFVTLTNSEASSITISQQSTSSGFTTSGLSLPLTLASGQSFTFSVVFSPSSAGAVTGIFDGWDGKSDVFIGIPLTGTGTAAGQLTVSPPSVNFGNVTVGQSASQPGTLSASGASVTVSSATSNSLEFTFSGLTLPVTIASGQSLAYTTTFTPQSSGTASASLSFVSNASDPNTSESLTGTGVPAQQYSVSLSWNASTSPVAGYNVYRGSKSGGPYSKINSGLDASTSYTDSSVAAGRTYYYVTTAVNSEGQESPYSNQAQAVVP
jgi:Abnormal spindle-like microcephaly-assoc'd, ASPM-SPD-2-Hydin/HYDIN/CFA65/VesB-like, Ig-like domain